MVLIAQVLPELVAAPSYMERFLLSDNRTSCNHQILGRGPGVSMAPRSSLALPPPNIAVFLLALSLN